MYRIRFNKNAFSYPYSFSQIKKNKLGEIIEISVSMFSYWKSKNLTTAEKKLKIIKNFYRENNKQNYINLFEIEEC